MQLQLRPVSDRSATAADDVAWRWLDSARYLQVGEDGFVPELPAGDSILVSLKLWRLRYEDLAVFPEPLGVVLELDDDPIEIRADLHRISVVAINFASSADERGRSMANLLRQRYGYRGELAALALSPACSDAGVPNGFDAIADREDAASRIGPSRHHGRGHRAVQRDALGHSRAVAA